MSIEHNSGSQCHRDKGVGSFDSDDQSASQDHCEAIKPCPQQPFRAPQQHVPQTSIERDQRDISGQKCHRNKRVGLFDSGQQAANPESPQHSLATPQQPLSSTLATKIHRGISSILNVTEAWELVYIIHTDKKPLEYRDCQLPSHSLATKQSTLATVLQDLYLFIRTSYRDGGWFIHSH